MDLQQSLTKILKPYKEDRFLLGVSGGLDSMALLVLFCHFRKHFSFQFEVVHIHHGPAATVEQEEFRFMAWESVFDFCKDESIVFHSNYDGKSKEHFLKSFEKPLTSEQEFRDFREGYVKSLKPQVQWDWWVMAHHKEDLLETRIMRLIRGVGLEGLASMEVVGDGVLRPFLSISQENLKDYLKFKNVSWLEDPSNGESDYFRNWMRNKWLPELEAKRPGALKSLGRSLDLILEGLQDHSASFSCIKGDEILIPEFLLLSYEGKSQVLATYMRNQGLRNYGVSHIKEVLKRLDSEKKRLTFQLLGRSWLVDAGRLKVLGLGSIEPT